MEKEGRQGHLDGVTPALISIVPKQLRMKVAEAPSPFNVLGLHSAQHRWKHLLEGGAIVCRAVLFGISDAHHQLRIRSPAWQRNFILHARGKCRPQPLVKPFFSETFLHLPHALPPNRVLCSGVAVPLQKEHQAIFCDVLLREKVLCLSLRVHHVLLRLVVPHVWLHFFPRDFRRISHKPPPPANARVPQPVVCTCVVDETLLFWQMTRARSKGREREREYINCNCCVYNLLTIAIYVFSLSLSLPPPFPFPLLFTSCE